MVQFVLSKTKVSPTEFAHVRPPFPLQMALRRLDGGGDSALEHLPAPPGGPGTSETPLLPERLK